MTEPAIRIKRTSRRGCFYRGERAVLKFDLMNFSPRNVYGGEFTLRIPGLFEERRVLPKLGWHLSDLAFEVDTAGFPSGSPGVRAELRKQGQTLSSAEFKFDVVPQPDPEAVAFWHWPSTVHYDALEAGDDTAEAELDKLASLGVTWSQFRAGWALDHPDRAIELIEKAMKRGIQLGILIENTAGGIFRADPGTPEEALRVNLDGTRSAFLNPFHAFTQEKARFLVRRLMTHFAEFPSCTTLFINSELEDKLKLPCDPGSLRRHEERLGFPVSRLRSVERIFAESYPGSPAVIGADDPEVAYARYYFREGDGWCAINRIMTETAQQYRPDLVTVADPLRLAPLPERFDGVGAISSWTYTNPDPKFMLYAETLAAAARRTGKPFIHTVTLWNYAGTLTPCVEDRFAREYTLRMGPDRWKECCWINLARGPLALACYFGSPIEPFLEGGDPAIYSPETEQAMAEFNREVLKPCGKLARATENLPRRAAVLDCFTSRVHGAVPRSHAHYQNYQIYDFYTVMNMAQIPADVVFEEDLLEGALDRYDLLALPAADTLTEPVYRRIVDFAKRGGCVIADRYFRAEVPGLIRFDFNFSYRRNVNANAICTGSDFAVADDTNFRTEWGARSAVRGVTADEDQRCMEGFAAKLRKRLAGTVRREFDFDNPRVLGNMRTGGSMRYLFAANDSRTWDERSGRYRAMMEKGVPAHTVCRISGCREQPYLHEMISQKPLAVRDEGDGEWSFELTLPAAGGAIVAISARPPEPPAVKVTQESESVTIDLTISESDDTVRLVQLEIREPDGTQSEFNGTRLVRNGRLTFTLPVLAGSAAGVRQLRVTDLTSGRSTVAKWEICEEMEAAI
ncbi:MAG: hypothetical protein HPZ91_13475 [Lentisphaeria bacterium]|nr:hypothetical protein [Lentisphaeria bacterium]